MKKTIQLINPNKAADSFRLFIQEGLTKVYNACKLYVDLIDQSVEDAEIFRSKIPEIPAEGWKRYERVGRGNLHPNFLAWRSCDGVRKLENLSYTNQEKYSKENIIVLLSDGDKLSVSVQNLTKDQANQVFAKDHVRDIPEQKAFLEDLKMKKLREIELKKPGVIKYEKPYKIIGKTIAEINGVRFKRKDLIDILSEMEG